MSLLQKLSLFRLQLFALLLLFSLPEASAQLSLVTSPDVFICVPKTIGINASASGGTAPYSYSWSPATGLSASNIANPTVSVSSTTTYRVTVTDANSTTAVDSVTVNFGVFPPKIQVIPTTDTLCGPDTVRLNIENSANCALNGSECLTSTTKSILGTGTTQSSANTISPYHVSPFFFNAIRSNKRQYLIQPAELRGLGLQPNSSISSLGFFVNSFTFWTYENFTIKMGCSVDSTFSNTTFQTGLQTVFQPKTVVVVNGSAWTEYTFEKAFTWDGVSSIVVEICFNNSSNQGFNGPLVRFDNLIGQNIALHRTANSDVCGFTAGFFNLTTRPHMRFGICQVTHETPLSYSWTPGTGLNSTNVYNPLATVTTSTNYVLTATDTNGCVVQDTAKIVVAGDFNITPIADTILCSPGPFPLNVTDNAGAGATYNWKPAGIIANPVSNATNATLTANTTFTIDVKSAGGCLKSDTFNVGLLQPIGLDILTPDSIICQGDSLVFDVKTEQQFCVTTSTACSSPLNVKLGTGTNVLQGSTVSPFSVSGVNQNSQKKHIIIRKSELNLAGINDPSAISSLAITFSNISGITTFQNFTIKMGCTTNSEFNFVTNTEFESPLQTVFNPKTVTISTGLNTYSFDNNFVWNGTDNLLIEFCFENTLPLTIFADFQSLPSSNAGFGTVLTKTGVSVCNDLSGGFISFFRPDITLSVCDAPPREDLSYQWLPATALNNDTMAETAAGPAATTQYILTAGAKNSSCFEKDTINIDVAPNFTTTTTKDTTICEAGTLPVFVNNTPAFPVTVSWEPSSLFTNASSPSTTVNLPASNVLIARVESAAGCVKFDTINAGVQEAVDKIATSSSGFVCKDSIVQLDASITLACGLSNANDCNGSLNARPGGPFLSSNASSITPFISDALSMKKQYLFRANELIAAGMTTSSKIRSISFEVNSLGFVTNYQNFSIKVGCANRNQYGNRFQNGLSTVFTPKTVTIGIGSNTFVFDEQYNWDGVSNLVVEVCFANTGFVSPFWPGSAVDYNTTSFASSILFGSQTPACNSTTGGSVSVRPAIEFGFCSNPQSFTYNWTPINTLNNPSINNPTAQPDSTTTYVITFTESTSGCEFKDSVRVQVADFEVQAINDTTVCNSLGLTLGVTTNAKSPFSYEWFPANSLSDSSLQAPTISNSQGGVFKVEVRDSAGCVLSDSVLVDIFPDPLLNVSPDTTICPSDQLFLFAFGGTSFSWSPTTGLSNPLIPNPIVSGLKQPVSYIVEILDLNDCLVYDTVNVGLHPTPTINLGKDSTYCSDYTSVLDAGSGFIEYRWSTGDTSSSIVVSPPGLFSVRAEDQFGCIETDSIQFGVIPAPFIDLKDEYLLCENDSLILDAGNPGAVYNWSTGETERMITIKNGGDYYIDLFNGQCPGVDSFSVKVLAIPIASMEDTVSYCINDLPFGAPVSAGSSEYSYQWSNGKRVPQVELSEEGVYTVLITNGPDDCSILDTVVVEQFCKPEFFIPNSFTPNEDGINDEFSIIARNIYEFNFKVFNRWGEVVYETDNKNFSWNGYYDGKLLNKGLYVWKMNYVIQKKDDSFESKSKDGRLFILR